MPNLCHWVEYFFFHLLLDFFRGRDLEFWQAFPEESSLFVTGSRLKDVLFFQYISNLNNSLPIAVCHSSVEFTVDTDG